MMTATIHALPERRSFFLISNRTLMARKAIVY
jgi:hypothetical protein